ncbi:MAG: SUMF1/EgtB/PvdO family nonheme iron enzyme [Pseudomonadota bacterium]
MVARSRKTLVGYVGYVLLAPLAAPLVAACGSSTPSPSDCKQEDDASTDSPAKCHEEGAKRVNACAKCGTRAEMCQDGTWQPTSECLGQGICPVGEVETQHFARCGAEQRICTEACAWTPWELVKESSGCTPGLLGYERSDCNKGLYRKRFCTDECRWADEVSGDCVEPCAGGPRRTTPADAEEICIPAGPFMRGSTRDPGATPVREVVLSSYYVDRYPVTNRRYRECLEAGGCPQPSSEWAAMYVADPALDNHPADCLSWDEAKTFCEWDGSHRLVTEAEWEKAARGPAPRQQLYVWDEDELRCDLLEIPACGYVPDPNRTYDTDPIDADAVAGARSYYGVDMMLGGGTQWTADYFDENYYSREESLVSPCGPAAGEYHVVRGEYRVYATANDHVTTRYQGAGWCGFLARCARDAAPELGVPSGGSRRAE